MSSKSVHVLNSELHPQDNRTIPIYPGVIPIKVRGVTLTEKGGVITVESSKHLTAATVDFKALPKGSVIHEVGNPNRVILTSETPDSLVIIDDGKSQFTYLGIGTRPDSFLPKPRK